MSSGTSGRTAVQAARAAVGYAPNGIVAGFPLPGGQELFILGATVPGADEEMLASAEAVPLAVVREDETNLRTGHGTRYNKVE